MASRIWHSLGWRRRLLLLALPVVLAGAGLLAVILFFPSPSAPAATAPPAPNSKAAGTEAADALPAAGGLLVEVTGAVARPGLYRVAKGERVYAAIAAAGGFTADADPDRLPALAARLRDGQQIRVPSHRSPAGARTTRTASRVSLNSASAEELAAVPGFTADLAAAAVHYRSEYGGFQSTRELVTVLQMSEADYQLARRYLTT